MQKFKLTINNVYKDIVLDINTGVTESISASQAHLQLINNYYVYSNQIGGGIVNDNNVRDFLDANENSILAEQFVTYLKNNTTFEEFKEIFYDNKKLSHVFNEFYKISKLGNNSKNTELQVSNSLKNTSGISVSSSAIFNPHTNRRNNIQDYLLTTVPLSANSYFINIEVPNHINLTPKGDYSQYFQDCTKGAYVYKRYNYINNIISKKLYGNIPYIQQLKESLNNNYGYAPIEDSVLKDLYTPIFAGQGRGDGPVYDFYDFSQWQRHFNYLPKPILQNNPGFFISQDTIDINSNNYSSFAKFISNPMTEIVNGSTGTTIPVKVKLNYISTGITKLYLKAEQFSTATLENDFILTYKDSKSNILNFNVPDSSDETNLNIVVFSAITTDETIIISLRDINNNILSYLILRGEELFLINQNTDNSFISLNNVTRIKTILRCYVDLNYNDNELEVWHNDNIQIFDHTKDNKQD